MDVRGEELKESEGSKTSDLEKEYRVTPWEVEGVVDYNKIVEEFGTRLITPEIIAKLQRFSGSIHPLLSRGFFFSHRDLHEVPPRDIRIQAIISDYRLRKISL